ncbi:hypothetical protein FQR65_LT01111 [Abscondita terminalis]|nr:hypothetical protein FQR65_LT01111 [Abscondita terminalis]
MFYFNTRRKYVAICKLCAQYGSTRSFDNIPGPLALPGIGTLYKYLPLIGSYKFDRLHWNGLNKLRKYGPVVRERIVPGVNIVWLFKPEDIEAMFRCEGKYPQRRSHLALEKYRLDRPNVYNTGGLLPTNGADWLRLRSIFQKGLSSPSAVQNFLPETNEIIQEWLCRLEDICKTPDLVYANELSRLFLELICFVALDMRMNSFTKRELKSHSRSSQLMKAALTTNSCILKTDNGPQLWRKFETPLYKKLKKSQQFMEEVAIDMLSLKMSFFDEDKKQGSLLESYLSCPDLDFKDIIGVVCDFLLAGVDTTSYTTSFILYHLARNRLSQSTLFQECRRLLPEPDSPVTKEVLSQAQYAKAVLKESLRLRPISVGIGRILDKDAQFSNFNVPRGTVVVSQNQVSCRLKEYFPDPNEFRPERWLKNQRQYQQPHPFLVIPFGHGARSCIARRLAEQNMLVFIMKVRNDIMHKRKIIVFAILTRVFVLILQFVANILIPDHDANVFLYPKNNTGDTVYDDLVKLALGGLLRWDAQYFMHIAKYGYTHENTLAFFPLYPMTIRAIASLFSAIFTILNEDSILLLTFTTFNVFIFVKAATTLYTLSSIILNADLAYKSAILFCINPASIFFTAPYTETLFSYLCFKSMLNCLLIYDKQSSKINNIINIIIPISLSACVRSNGLLNIGFISYYLVKTSIKSLIFQKTFKKKFLHCIRCLLLFISSVYLCIVPFMLLQFFDYQLFCTDFQHELPNFLVKYVELHDFILPGMVSKYQQSWCFNKIPLAYSYIQKHYWKVGFLKYFEFKQIPNFLLAFPVIALILYNGTLFMIMHKQHCLNLGIFNFKYKFLNTKIKSNNAYIFKPSMFVFVVHGMLLVLFCFFCVHVQITTRMLCSASPLIYWFCAIIFNLLKNWEPN